ncbi:hypothetical protein G7054_g8581 [Neopestalotiopsis clavispora]|nr:hypothetical protein G7054_g8581 [Neopestalotiopsis clavispora]
MIEREVEGQREHFDNLELHIGYVYGSKEVPAHASHYKAKYVPGARLPHAWISLKESSKPDTFQPLDVSYVKEWTAEDVAARQASTLDLCSHDAFTLIVGDQHRWKQRFDDLQKALGAETDLQIRLWSVGADFNFAFPEQGKLFCKGFGLESGGAVLVRPDQHTLAVLKPGDSASDVKHYIMHHLRPTEIEVS